MPVVGYDATSEDIVVKVSIDGGTTSSAAAAIDGYIYNLDTKNWYVTHKAMSGVMRNGYIPATSNFVNDKFGNLISYVHQTSDTYEVKNILRWKHIEGSDVALCENLGILPVYQDYRYTILNTKDFAFGDIHRKKKIYKIYLTYRSNGDSKITSSYYLDGDNSTTYSFKTGTNYSSSNGYLDTGTSSGTTIWKTAELIPDSPINNAYSISLYFIGLQAKNTFAINDISFVYRDKRVK